MKDATDFARAVVRPFVMIWGFMVYGICIMTEVEVPLMLSGLVSAVIVEYFGERAIKRFKE